ncbi:MAG: hypothetical protein CMB80_16540, partial [Flammeovirgaceae bacterium]|nr:hypothetical protein [Flammeovirgaceae bacterium]
DAQKKQAFFNAAMKGAKDAVSKLGAEQLSSQDKFDQFGATLDDFQAHIGERVTPVVLGFLEGTAKFMKEIMETDLETALRQMKELGATVEQITVLQRAVALDNAKTDIKKNADIIKREIEGVGLFFTSLSDEQIKALGGTFEEIRTGGIMAGDSMKKVITAGDPLRIQQETVQKLLEDNLAITTDIDAENIEASAGQRVRLHAENEALAIILRSLLAIAKANDIIADKQTKRQQGGTGGGKPAPTFDPKLRKEEIDQIRTRIALLNIEGSNLSIMATKLGESAKQEKAHFMMRKEGIDVDQEIIDLMNEEEGVRRKVQGMIDENIERIKMEDAVKSALADTTIAQKDALNELLTKLEDEAKWLKGSPELYAKHQEAIANVKEELEDFEPMIEQLASMQDLYSEFYTAAADLVIANQNRIIDGIKKQNQIEIAELRKTNKYKRASEKEQAKMEAAVKSKREKEVLDAFRMQQLAQVGQVWMNIALAVAKQFAETNFWSALSRQPTLLAIGAIQSAAIMAQKPPRMAQGGLIGGNRHSQGGTMINAEQGEFVMSRSAVESVGIENLNQMNQGGGGGSAVTVNVSGNVMSQDYVEGELAEQIKEAIRRGEDFGIS